MRYLIWVHEDAESEPARMVGDLPEDRREFLAELVLPALRPLSEEQYRLGLVAVLETVARFSYVLTDDAVLWCIEWEPGLVVVRSTPGGDLSYAAVRSPVPHFAGREPSPEDLASDWHEDDPNPCYSLVYDAWDAQHDEQDREWGGFQPATPEDLAHFEGSMARLNELGQARLEELGEDEAAREAWTQACLANLSGWLGPGIRF